MPDMEEPKVRDLIVTDMQPEPAPYDPWRGNRKVGHEFMRSGN